MSFLGKLLHSIVSIWRLFHKPAVVAVQVTDTGEPSGNSHEDRFAREPCSLCRCREQELGHVPTIPGSGTRCSGDVQWRHVALIGVLAITSICAYVQYSNSDCEHRLQQQDAAWSLNFTQGQFTCRKTVQEKDQTSLILTVSAEAFIKQRLRANLMCFKAMVIPFRLSNMEKFGERFIIIQKSLEEVLDECSTNHAAVANYLRKLDGAEPGSMLSTEGIKLYFELQREEEEFKSLPGRESGACTCTEHKTENKYSSLQRTA